MDNNQLQLCQTRSQFIQIKNLLDEYKRVIQQKFDSNQGLLIQQLEQKTIKLKQNIALYRKQTAPENIQKLITDKRHEKQLQRLELQVQWRNLTEKYKKLQQEEKRIKQENRQNFFDIQNLQKKIAQLQQANKTMNDKIKKIKCQVDDQTFLTKINSSYISPYKFKAVTEDSFTYSKPEKVGKVSNNFRLKLESKKKHLTLDKQNNYKRVQSLRSNEKLNFSTLLLKKNDFVSEQQKKIGSLELSNLYTYKQQKNDPKQKQISLDKGAKYKQLMHYLSKPEVKDKIFDLLRKQYQNQA